MRVSEALKPGRFWDFYNRFKRERMSGLAVIGCSELAGWLEQFLHPAIPQLLFQNEGGCCQGVKLDPSITDLLVLHHHPCAFSCRTPGMSLVRTWKELRAQRKSLHIGPDLAVHFWLLDHQGGLRIFDPESGFLRSPIEISGMNP
ncbi:hypothetical protein JST97_06110 [bacterium]|nr:hypothetical protein [bacterium]